MVDDHTTDGGDPGSGTDVVEIPIPRVIPSDPTTWGFDDSDTTDQRTLTRRRRQRELHARLTAQKTAREELEALIGAAAASGANFTQIARQLGVTTSYISKVHKRMMARPGDRSTEDYRSVQLDRLNRLLFATWGDSMDNMPTSVRNSLRLVQEMNRMTPGAYPRPGDDDEGEEQRDTSIERVAVVLERLHNQRERQEVLAIEAHAVPNVDPRPRDRNELGRAAFPPPDEAVDAEIVDEEDDDDDD